MTIYKINETFTKLYTYIYNSVKYIYTLLSLDCKTAIQDSTVSISIYRTNSLRVGTGLENFKLYNRDRQKLGVRMPGIEPGTFLHQCSRSTSAFPEPVEMNG